MKAMILAAGVGSRLGALGADKPKCLMPVGSKTILEHVVDHLKNCGVQRCVINLHHHGRQVEDFIRSRAGFGLEFEFSHEANLLGTGGGLKNIARLFSEEPYFIVHNADIYCEFDLKKLVAFHRRQKVLASLAVMKREDSSYLLFDDKMGLVGWQRRNMPPSFCGKPLAEATSLGFCGIQIVTPEIFPLMAGQEAPFSIIDTYMRAAGQGKKITGFMIGDNYWIDMGTPGNLELLRARLS